MGVGKYKDLQRYSHGGADIAHRAFISYFPEINSGTIVLSNFAGFPTGNIVAEVNKSFLGEHFKPEKEKAPAIAGYKVSIELLKKYSGKYLLEVAGMVISFNAENEKFVIQATGQPKLDLIALNDSTFKVEGVEAEVTFIANKDGIIEKAILNQNGKHELVRLADYSPDVAELKEFEGHYINKNLETLYSVKVKDSILVIKHINLKDIELEPIEEDSFKGNVFFMNKVVFKRNKNGGVESFSVSNGRTKNIIFEKI